MPSRRTSSVARESFCSVGFADTGSSSESMRDVLDAELVAAATGAAAPIVTRFAYAMNCCTNLLGFACRDGPQSAGRPKAVEAMVA